MKQIGPNVKRLIIHKMALIAIPAGSGRESLHVGVSALSNLPPIWAEAAKWVEAAIAAVRTAPDNPYTTDEEIAGAILKGIAERKP